MSPTHYKIYLTEGDSNNVEVYRFCAALPRLTQGFSFLKDLLAAKIATALHGKSFRIYWKDEDGDLVNISNDDELMTFLDLDTSPCKKLYVRVGERGSRSASQNSEFLHKDFTCSECFGEIKGICFICLQCIDYSTCENCAQKRLHGEHVFAAFLKPLPQGKQSNILKKIHALTALGYLDEGEHKSQCDSQAHKDEDHSCRRWRCKGKREGKGKKNKHKFYDCGKAFMDLTRGIEIFSNPIVKENLRSDFCERNPSNIFNPWDLLENAFELFSPLRRVLREADAFESRKESDSGEEETAAPNAAASEPAGEKVEGGCSSSKPESPLRADVKEAPVTKEVKEAPVTEEEKESPPVGKEEKESQARRKEDESVVFGREKTVDVEEEIEGVEESKDLSEKSDLDSPDNNDWALIYKSNDISSDPYGFTAVISDSAKPSTSQQKTDRAGTECDSSKSEKSINESDSSKSEKSIKECDSSKSEQSSKESLKDPRIAEALDLLRQLDCNDHEEWITFLLANEKADADMVLSMLEWKTKAIIEMKMRKGQM